MANKNRVPVQQVRDEFLLETNFDDEQASTTRAYQVNRNDDNNGTIRTNRSYRSNLSVDRYSIRGKSGKEGDAFLEYS